MYTENNETLDQVRKALSFFKVKVFSLVKLWVNGLLNLNI